MEAVLFFSDELNFVNINVEYNIDKHLCVQTASVTGYNALILTVVRMLILCLNSTLGWYIDKKTTTDE